MIELPLLNGVTNARQVFYVQLGDNFCEIKLSWVHRASIWSLDLYVEGDLRVAGAALVPTCNIIATYAGVDGGIGSLFFIGIEATLDNLGQDNKLLWSNA